MIHPDFTAPRVRGRRAVRVEDAGSAPAVVRRRATARTSPRDQADRPPYTLVLTKLRELFDLERQSRLQDGKDLEWVTTTWNATR